MRARQLRVSKRNSSATSQAFGRNSAGNALSDKQSLRLKAILEILQETGSVSVDELSSRFAVSVVTTRRDLDVLEKDGRLRRTHGGAVSIEPLFYEPFRDDRSFQAQVEKFADEKRRIARAAAALVGAGETIALTAGTTTTEVVRCLPINCNITVVTNTVNIAMELSKRKDLNVFVTGGHLHGDWFSLVGPTAIQSLKQIMIHTLFIGADGLDAQWGATCFSSDEADLNSALVSVSRRRIAVVDHSKFAVTAGWRICPTTDIHMLITDNGTTDETVAEFERNGVQVLRV
jgi:DeoR family transcriptional regulator of aga operon